MTDNSIEKRLDKSHPISAADSQFIEDMRRAAANEVGYGFMQQVTEWEWQDKHDHSWGPEYFDAEIDRLSSEVKNLKYNIDYYKEMLEEIQKVLGSKMAKDFVSGKQG